MGWAKAMNVKQGGSMSQPRKMRALHVHDHRSRGMRPAPPEQRNEPADANQLQYAGAARPLPPPVPAPGPSPLPTISPSDPTWQQPAVTQMPVTEPLPRVPPTIDFPD